MQWLSLPLATTSFACALQGFRGGGSSSLPGETFSQNPTFNHGSHSQEGRVFTFSFLPDEAFERRWTPLNVLRGEPPFAGNG